MTTSQIDLYNGALRLLGQRKLAAVDENTDARRYLDSAWDDQAREYCLQQGFWKHAKTSLQIFHDPSFTPAFGYRYRFNKPDDFIRTYAVASDAYNLSAIDLYSDEAGAWLCDIDPIYVQYIGSTNGLNYALWPPTFTKWVEAWLAQECSNRFKLDANERKELSAKVNRFLVDARSKDALDGPMRLPRTGRWAMSRRGSRSGQDRMRGRPFYGN